MDLKKFLFILLLYLVVFNPPFSFLPISPKSIIGFCTVFFLLDRKFLNIVLLYRRFFIIITFIVLYVFFRDSFHGVALDVFNVQVYLYLDWFLTPLFLLYLYNKMKLKESLIELLFKCGVLAVCLSLVSFFIPFIGDFFRYDLLKTSEITEFISFRNFGLAESLTSIYTIVLALIYLLLVFFIKGKRILLWTPLFIVSILINARTGFTVVIIGVLLYAIYIGKVAFVFRLFSYLVLFMLFIPLVSISNENAKTIEWALSFFDQIKVFFLNERRVASDDANTFDVLFDEMLVLPSNTGEWLFGSGRYIFGQEVGLNSDIGYILQLYYGGIVYLLLIFIFLYFLYQVVSVFRGKNVYFYYYGVTMLLSLVVVNIKGDVFSTTGVMRFVILVVFYFRFIEKFKNEMVINK